jgi:heme-binding protein
MVERRRSVRRRLVSVIGACAVLQAGVCTAAADPGPAAAPNCTAGDLAVASGTVGTAMGDYLFGHPDVNDFFTSLRGLPNSEIHDRVQSYMDAHPQTESDINGIRQPLTELRTRCDLGPSPIGS